MFIVSALTFLIFFAFPASNPALRLAGRTATPDNRSSVSKEWGFDKPIYVQYVKMMGKIFTAR